MYHEDALYSDIGAAIGRSHERVRQIVKEMKLPPREPFHVRRRKAWQAELTERRDELLQSYAEVGYTIHALSRHTGISADKLHWALPASILPERPEPPHGTDARYRSRRFNCRCDECRAAHTASQLENRAWRSMEPVPDHVVHGTLNAYGNYGCRCDECKEAQRVHNHASYVKRLAGPTPDHVHGTVNGFSNYGCRCDLCCQAQADKNNRRKERA